MTNCGQWVSCRHEGRVDARVDHFIAQIVEATLSHGEQFDHVTGARRFHHVVSGDLRDAFDADIVHGYA